MNEWTQHIETYLTHHVGQSSPVTLRQRGYVLRQLATSLPAPSLVTLDDLIGCLARADWAPETRRFARSALRSFYRWAHRTGRVAADVSEHLPPVRVPPGVARPTPDGPLGAALAGASTRDRLMVLLATLGGLRAGEIAAIHVHDVGSVSLLVRGKGGRRREVPLHPLLAAALHGEADRRRAGERGDGYRFTTPASTALFPSHRGGTLRPSSVSRMLSRRLGPGWTGHTLRHRFASTTYAHERDLLAVQQLLGHASVATTQRYVAVPDDTKRAAVLAIRLPLAA